MKSSSRLSKEQIKEVMTTGRAFHGDNVYLKVKTINKGFNSLFAIVIPAKVVRNVITRNKIKRQIRYILDQQISNIDSGYGIIIVLKTNIKELDFEDLKKQILNLLTQSKILLS